MGKRVRMMFFYDPHPGLAGCVVPIPSRVRELAARISGDRMLVSRAVTMVRRAAGQGFVVKDAGDYISLRTDGEIGVVPVHSWCVIRYALRNPAPAKRRTKR